MLACNDYSERIKDNSEGFSKRMLKKRRSPSSEGLPGDFGVDKDYFSNLSENCVCGRVNLVTPKELLQRCEAESSMINDNRLPQRRIVSLDSSAFLYFEQPAKKYSLIIRCQST
jgi:hypothetical protein